MHQYAFILGRKPWLSLAELAAVLPNSTQYQEMSGNCLLVKLLDPLENPQHLLNILGGSIKIIQIEAFSGLDLQLIPKNIAKLALNLFKGAESKVRFAVSTENLDKRDEGILKSTLILTKNTLTEAGIKPRFLNKDFQNPALAALKGEKVPTKSTELVALKFNKQVFYGKTIAIQDIDAYSFRDFKRPGRDARVGMLPPKLSQIMINLSGINKDWTANPSSFTVYDPFCGLGTILMEAALMGFNVAGSDIEPAMIKHTETNLKWLQDAFQLPEFKSQFFEKDATYLNEGDLSTSPTAIVSETFLGPPVSVAPKPENIEKTFYNLENLLLGFFESLAQFIPGSTPIVVSFLAYRLENRILEVPGLIDKIEQLGFKAQPLLDQQLIDQLKLHTPPQESLLYERPDQIVCRAIYKFHYNPQG